MLGEGSHTFTVRATDAASNTDGTPASHTWVVDTTAPDTTLTATEPNPTNDTTGDFTFTSTEGSSTFECSVDNAAFTTCTTPFSTAVLSAGSHTFAVRAIDAANNTDGTPASHTWLLDTSAPDTTLTATEPNPTNDTTGDFTFTSTEPGSTFECSVDNAAFTTCTTPFSTAVLGQGSHSFAVRAVSPASNTDPSPATHVWTVDTIAPDTSFTATEPNPTNDTTGDFTFTSTEGSSTFECSVDGASFSSCTSPFATAVLGQGSHTLWVKATDAAANTDATPASHTWVVDTTAPDTSFTATEPNPTNDTTGDFSFTSSEGSSTFECSVDGSSFTTCTSPFATAALSQASHTLSVKATDAAGNTDATPASHTWVVDTTAPDTSFTATEPNPTNDTTGDFTFTSTEGSSTFECAVDGGSFSTCTSPFATAVLGQGSHTLLVRATDAASNTDATPASHTWVVDTAAPDTSFTTTEPNPTNDNTGDFTFTSTEGSSTFECSVDGASFSSCASPFSTAALSQASHTLLVRATDPANNTDATPASHTWVVDTTAPDTTLTGTEPNPTNDTTGDFTFTSTEGSSTFTCSVDGASFTTCSTPFSTTALSAGSHTFDVKATDAAGNTDSSAASHTWVLDTTAPDTTLTATEPNPTNDTTGDFTFTSTEGSSTFECSVDSAAFTACSSPFATAVLGQGSHTFAVRATDAASNTDGTPASHTWVVDTAAPNTTLTATEPNPTNDTTGDFTFTSTEGSSTFECSVDGAAFTTCSTPFSTAVLSAGPHTFAVRATDAASNTDATPATHSWTLDLTAPDTTLTATEPNPTNDTTGDFAFTSTEGSSTFECSVDGASFSSCTTPFSTAVLSPGSHTFAVKATDAAGNTDSTPSSYTWVLDTTAPDTTLTGTEPDPTNDTTGDFTFTSTEGSSTFQCSVDSAAFTSCTTPFSTAVLGQGSHTFAVRATDAAGNTDATPATYLWVVDTTAPGTNLTATEPNPTNDTTGDFAFSSTESLSTFECSVDSAAFASCTSPFSTAVLSPGAHTFAVRATDAAGNTDASPATHSWTLDTTAPDTSFTATEPDPTSDTTGDFAFSSTEGSSTFACSVDSAAFTSCSSPFSTAVLGLGSHTFAVRATDAAGNTDATPASHTWTVEAPPADTTAPDTTLTATEPNPTTDPSGDFAFTSTEAGSTFACSVDGASFSPCATPFSTADLALGSHTFAVRATDAAGNTDATPASHTWTVEAPVIVPPPAPDTTAPDTTLTATEPNPTSDPTADFSFTSNEAGSTFSCSVDSAPFSACSSPFSTVALSPGSHTFAVRATDAAGNTDATPASHSWSLAGSSAPTTWLTEQPPSISPSTTAVFNFSGSEAGRPDAVLSFACALDGAAPFSCVGPIPYNGLSQGVHSFRVVATNELGVTGSPVSTSWRVDSIAPTIKVTAAPLFSTGASVGTSYAGADTGGSGIANYDVRYRTAAYNRGFAPTVTPPTWQRITATSRSFAATPGSTSCFSTRSRDLAGNVSGWSPEACVVSPLDDRSLVRSAGWSVSTDRVYYRQTATNAFSTSRSLSLTRVQARRISLVASTCATCGAVGVYWNGTLLRTVSLRSTTVKHRQVITVADLGVVRTGTVTIRTLNGRTVRIDGLGIARV